MRKDQFIKYLIASSSSWKSSTYPSGLYVAAISDTSIRLDWTNNGTSDYTGHKAYISTDKINYTLNKTVASIETNMTLTGLTANTHYWIKICAYKGSKISAYSNVNDDVTYPALLVDSNSFAIIFGNDYSAITKDSATRVSQINDRGGSNNHFIQSGEDALKPLWNMVEGWRFDGVDDLITTGDKVFNQPAHYYIVLKQQTWTLNDRFFDSGPSAAAAVMMSQTNVAPKIIIQGATASAYYTIPFNKYIIIRAFFNGASGKLQYDAATAITGNYGTASPSGITLGAARTGAIWANMEMKGFIARKIADDAAGEATIYAYLVEKFFNRTLNLVYEGHSMINLSEVAGDICVCDYTENKLMLNHGIKFKQSLNVAVGGATIANIITRYATSVTARKDVTAGVSNLLIVFIGTNDITSGMSGTDAYNALKGYVDQTITDGWIPIIITMTKRGDATVNVQRLIFNNAIKANTDYDYVVDVDSVPELTDNTNTTYFNANQIHLISAGSEKLAVALSAKIKEAIDNI
jgi:hypothetical protein